MFKRFLGLTILELFAIAYMVGGDLCVGAHTQVSPYTDSQTALGSCATDGVITITKSSHARSVQYRAHKQAADR